MKNLRHVINQLPIDSGMKCHHHHQAFRQAAGACHTKRCESDHNMQGNLTRPEVKLEMRLLEKLLYKNKSQHRQSQHYRRLEEVCLSLLSAIP